MKYTLICLFSLLASSLWAGEKKNVVVNAGDHSSTYCVVSVGLPDLGMEPSANITLFEKTGEERKPVNCQVIGEKGGVPALYWILEGNTPAGASREYIVQESNTPGKDGVMQVDDTRRALILKKDGKEVLQYNYAITYPPAGIDPAYQRSGFIHPAYSPKGNILTTIQPKDHYHHYGIWNPWTKLEYDGGIYDLWNLKHKKGTVRAKEIENIYQGNVCAGYDADLDHCIFTPAGEKVIMNEVWRVKAWNVPGGFLWDFESNLSPATSLPVLLKAYRYAGFGWRATEEWTKENCEMFTSEGKTRQQIDGTNARWIYVTGQCGQNGRSGLLFLGHPGNRNAPEPLRIWDEKANGGRGDAFVNFAPTKNTDWKLEPGKQYTLRYRLFTYDGEMTSERADRLWDDFANPPKVTVIKR